MANTLNYATIFQQELDKKFVHDSVTAWMGRNAQLAQYNGGREIKIPKLDMDALADYSRSTGYTEGDVTLEYETRTMTRDRGRRWTRTICPRYTARCLRRIGSPTRPRRQACSAS